LENNLQLRITGLGLSANCRLVSVENSDLRRLRSVGKVRLTANCDYEYNNCDSDSNWDWDWDLDLD